MSKQYYIYIMTNPNNTVLYTGVTNNLKLRVAEHRIKLNSESFTARYNANKLVYYEEFSDIKKAIDREKQIKSGSRKKKLELIKKINPTWEDLTLSLRTLNG